MTGTAGFVACFIFIRSIYSAIKVKNWVYYRLTDLGFHEDGLTSRVGTWTERK